MESIVRNVKDIEADDRRSLEHVVGQQLCDNQQIIIQVMTIGAESGDTPRQKPSGKGEAATLPDWCNVYDGLSDDEIAEIETVILDRDHWSRSSQ